MTENPQSNPGQQPPAYGQQPPVYTGQPSAPQGQQPGPYGAPAVDPGKTMAIVSIILPFVGFSLIGLILAIIAKGKSKKAGYKNTLAFASIIINVVILILSIIGAIIGIIFFMNFIEMTNQAVEACQSGAETVTIAGQVYNCSSLTPSNP